MTSALDASRASGLELSPSLPSGISDALFIKNGSTRGNSSSYDIFPATLIADPVCDRDRYGSDLDRSSCDEALQKIGANMNPFTVARRDSPRKPVMRLPNRWSSSDGKCVIDLSTAPASISDVITTAQIGAAARRVIDQCIPAVGSTAGGSVAEIGMSSKLIVIIRKYEPSVTCGGEPPPIGSCSKPLSVIPVSGDRLLFGYKYIAGVQVPTPKSFRGSASSCALTVSTPELAAYGTWFDLWAGAVAVDALCVDHGQAGIARNIGEDEFDRLQVELRRVRSHPGGDEE